MAFDECFVVIQALILFIAVPRGLGRPAHLVVDVLEAVKIPRLARVNAPQIKSRRQISCWIVDTDDETFRAYLLVKVDHINC